MNLYETLQFKLQRWHRSFKIKRTFIYCHIISLLLLSIVFHTVFSLLIKFISWYAVLYCSSRKKSSFLEIILSLYNFATVLSNILCGDFLSIYIASSNIFRDVCPRLSWHSISAISEWYDWSTFVLIWLWISDINFLNHFCQPLEGRNDYRTLFKDLNKN